jgi:ArsR family transcriptional regulator
MLDSIEVARLLDILGNRNRRRIIELLRQKPCFVTEISDRLMLSPKAVIEHLQLMEREEILSFRLDERRRKYYYLANDISIVLDLRRQENIMLVPVTDHLTRFRQSLRKLNKMVYAREDLAANLRHLEADIDRQIREIIENGNGILQSEKQADLIIALSHYPLGIEDLHDLTGIPVEELKPELERLVQNRIVEKNGSIYRIQGVYAE